MEYLSAAALIVLSYAQNHAIEGYTQIGDDIGLPDHIVAAACRDLKACGKIRDYESSDDSVEYVQL